MGEGVVDGLNWSAPVSWNKSVGPPGRLGTPISLEPMSERSSLRALRVGTPPARRRVTFSGAGWRVEPDIGDGGGEGLGILLHGSRKQTDLSLPSIRLCDTNVARPTKPQHEVYHRNGNGYLGHSAWSRAIDTLGRTQPARRLDLLESERLQVDRCV